MSTSSNIAIFSLAYDPLVGGAELAIAEITRRLPERRFVCFMHRFKNDWQTMEQKGNMTIVRVGKGGESRSAKFLYIFRAWRAAERHHRAEPFQAIWGIMAAYGGCAALLFKLRHPRVPFLLTLQEGDSEEHILRRVGVFYPLWRLIFKRADYIQAISSYLTEFAKRHGATCPIDVVPNGVDLNKIKDQRFNIKDKESDKKIIITTSRLVYKNGIDILLRAFANIANRKSQIANRLIIAGGGPLEGDLKVLANNLGIAHCVDFLGSIPTEEIPQVLARGDVFVRPSRSEGLGSSFLEAMAAGVPVVGTAVGGIPDFLTDGETGLIARAEDPGDVARCIERVITDAPLREKVVKRARALIEKRYSWDRVTEEMQSIFNALKTRLRVVIATGIYPPEIGGPAYYAKELKDALERRGNTVKIAAYGSIKRLPTGLRHLAYFKKLCAFLFLSRPSAVIALDTFSVGFPAVFCGRLFGVPVVIRSGGDFLWEFYVERTGEKILLSEFYTKPRNFTLKEKLIFRLTRWTLRHADETVFSTRYQRDIFILAYRLSPKHVSIIENYYGPRQVSAKPQKKNFICFTRKLKWKNIDTLEAAFGEVRARHREISLHVGSLPREAYLERLQRCYAVILVSLGDISPNMILEAIQYRKPFILTSENGLEDRIRGVGLRADPLDEESIGRAIEILTDAKRYAEEERNIERFVYTHTYDEIAEEFIAAIARI